MTYVLEDNIGFVLRQVMQRHLAIFSTHMPAELTPTQFAALHKLSANGPLSQGLLGRLTAMDPATIKGVVDRLTRRGLTRTEPDPADARMLVVSLTEAGQALADQTLPAARRITGETLESLTAAEQDTLIRLLKKVRG